jgi:hypothetical protein
VAFDRTPQVYLEFMRRRGLDANALGRWYDLAEPFLINKRVCCAQTEIVNVFSDMCNVILRHGHWCWNLTPIWVSYSDFFFHGKRCWCRIGNLINFGVIAKQEPVLYQGGLLPM